MTENTVKNAIIDYLRRSGWLVLRVNSGAITQQDKGKKRFFNFAKWFVLGESPQTAGVSDILALHPYYPPLAIETKTPERKNNVSEAQDKFLAEWREHGGVTIIASSIDDVVDYLAKAS